MHAVKKELSGKNLTGLFSGAGPGDIKLFDRVRMDLKLEQFASCFDSDSDLSSTKELIQWLDDERAMNHIFSKREGLNTLKEWDIDDRGFFSHKQKKFFKVVGVKITSPCREIDTWSQPILDNEGTGVIGLLMKRFAGRTYFLMQAKVDVGNRNIVQIGPTVQFNPGNYIDNDKLKKPFLFGEFLDPREFPVVKESMQAEEGGRFFKEENIHRILMLPDCQTLNVPPQHRWFSYNQIRFFLHLGDSVNSSARSILSCLT